MFSDVLAYERYPFHWEQIYLYERVALGCGYPNKTKGHVRITITERFNPLQKIPFLRNENAPLRMPYEGVDYNKIVD